MPIHTTAVLLLAFKTNATCCALSREISVQGSYCRLITQLLKVRTKLQSYMILLQCNGLAAPRNGYDLRMFPGGQTPLDACTEVDGGSKLEEFTPGAEPSGPRMLPPGKQLSRVFCSPDDAKRGTWIFLPPTLALKTFWED